MEGFYEWSLNIYEEYLESPPEGFHISYLHIAEG